MLHLFARTLGRARAKSKSTRLSHPDESTYISVPSDPIPQPSTPDLLPEPAFPTPTFTLNPNSLPHEIIEDIFIFSMSDGGYTAASLRLACRHFSETVRPYMFRYICVSGEHKLHSLSRALAWASLQQLKHVRHVFLSDRIREEADVSWHPAQSPDQDPPPAARHQKYFTDEAARLLPFYKMILNRIAPYVRTLRLLFFNTHIYSGLRGNGITSLVYIRLTSFSILRTYKKDDDVLFDDTPALQNVHIRLHTQSIDLSAFLRALIRLRRSPLLESIRLEGAYPARLQATFATQARRFAAEFPALWAESTSNGMRTSKGASAGRNVSTAASVTTRLRVDVHTCDSQRAPQATSVAVAYPNRVETPFEQIESKIWPVSIRIYDVQPLDDTYRAWKAAWQQ
jgi:hypothetical protein